MKTVRMLAAAALVAVAALTTGCGDKVVPQDIEIKNDSGLKRATNLLEAYAKGQQLGSEVASYENLVKDLRKEDAAKADVLEKGLEELKKTKGDATKSKAKEILGKLGVKPAS